MKITHAEDRLRLIWSTPAEGSMNMAIDDAVAEEVGSGNCPPTLRFYTWDPPCLSIGFTQPVEQADRKRILAAGWDLVRRPTGGRAILHTDELTYSICAPLDHPLTAGGVLASYQRLSEAIIHGLRLLGLQITVNEETKPQRHAEQKPVCFETPSAYEITAMGRKLVGSAQVRRRQSVLQHGTIPLHGDITRICDALSFPSGEEREKAAQGVALRAATIESLTGTILTAREVAGALCQGFQAVFGVTLIEDELSDREVSLAARLQKQRYSSPEWTERV